MNKATITEATILIASAALAAALATRIASHGVSTAAIVAVIAFTVTAGGSLAQSIGQAMRTTFYTCPTKGCAVSIRARDTSRDELTRLQAYATDHTKHGGAR